MSNLFWSPLAREMEDHVSDTVRAAHIGRRSPAGRLIYMANRLEAALEDGTLTVAVLAAISVLRSTAVELNEQDKEQR